ncbi:hypothetical protein PHYBOEH_008712 [Phytophthora boehmeriae]|uniref:Uncharacterized protein n=1 Tax=Phytophthora boehmeriae TaxID=109152 RepID=A0A8T1VZK2_9STRA|nr:hypothetical protein PHYBOEH_008712 [Phytophthora boehmeriae]
MGEGGGSGNDAGLRETPVDDPYIVYRGPPDYTFCSLPYTETRYASITDQYTQDHIYRMTSVYDTRIETALSDLNAGLGTAFVNTENEITTRSCRWFDLYAGMYDYYHVVSCQYNVFIENFGTEPLWAYQMFYNDVLPPGGATNEDMQLWAKVRYKYLDRRALYINGAGLGATSGENPDNTNVQEDTAGTGAASNVATSIVAVDGQRSAIFSGEYKPGMFRRNINLDSEVENWTAVTTNPALPEKLLIRIKPVNDGISVSDANIYGDDLRYKIQVKLNYLVEFKQLKQGLQWPVQRQPLTVTVAQSVFSTN